MEYDGEYELLPHEQVAHLRKELERLKGNPLISENKDKQLLYAINNLNDSISKLYDLFKNVNDELLQELGETGEGPRDKLDKVLMQNQQIAEGILSLADEVHNTVNSVEQRQIDEPEQEEIVQEPEPQFAPEPMPEPEPESEPQPEPEPQLSREELLRKQIAENEKIMRQQQAEKQAQAPKPIPIQKPQQHIEHKPIPRPQAPHPKPQPAPEPKKDIQKPHLEQKPISPPINAKPHPTNKKDVYMHPISPVRKEPQKQISNLGLSDDEEPEVPAPPPVNAPSHPMDSHFPSNSGQYPPNVSMSRPQGNINPNFPTQNRFEPMKQEPSMSRPIEPLMIPKRKKFLGLF